MAERNISREEFRDGSNLEMLATLENRLEFNPQKPHKILDSVACFCNLTTGKVETGKSLGVTGLLT